MTPAQRFMLASLVQQLWTERQWHRWKSNVSCPTIRHWHHRTREVRRVRRTAYDAYLKVAEEFSVPDYTVRHICGPVGHQTNISYEERLAVLRAKMDGAGLVPTSASRRKDIDRKDEEPDEPRELRSCVLCEGFLEDTDSGQDVMHAELDVSAVVCSRCRESNARI